MRSAMTFASSVLLLLATSCATVSSSDRAAISQSVAKIAELRSEAEQWAHRLKTDNPKGTPQYEAAYTRYIAAKAAFDTWIDRLAADLTLGANPASSAEYQTALADAASKGDEFVKFSKGTYEHSLNPALVVSWIGPLTDAAIKIWEKHNAMSASAKAEIVKTLQALKWKPFDQT
jgi:hypothetical protein